MSEPVNMGSGKDASLRVTCSDQEQCFQKADQSCPNGYNVVSHAIRSQDGEGMTLAALAMGKATEKGYLVFECKGGGDVMPSWQRDRQRKERDQAELASELVDPPPESLAGFILGSPLENARTLCEEADHRWFDADDGGKCTGMSAALDLSARTALWACGDAQAVCAVEVSGTPRQHKEAHEAWLEGLAVLKRQLSEKYGKPTSIKRNWPETCRGKALVACLQQGKASIGYRWSWKDGHHISLSLGRDGEDTPTIRLRYETPDYRERKRATVKPGERL